MQVEQVFTESPESPYPDIFIWEFLGVYCFEECKKNWIGLKISLGLYEIIRSGLGSERWKQLGVYKW